MFKFRKNEAEIEEAAPSNSNDLNERLEDMMHLLVMIADKAGIEFDDDEEGEEGEGETPKTEGEEPKDNEDAVVEEKQETKEVEKKEEPAKEPADDKEKDNSDDVSVFLKSKGLNDNDIQQVLKMISTYGDKENSVCKNEEDEQKEEKKEVEKKYEEIKENSLSKTETAYKNSLNSMNFADMIETSHERIQKANEKYRKK